MRPCATNLVSLVPPILLLEPSLYSSEPHFQELPNLLDLLSFKNFIPCNRAYPC